MEGEGERENLSVLTGENATGLMRLYRLTARKRPTVK